MISNHEAITTAWETGIGLPELKLHQGQYELFQIQENLPAHGRLFELCARRWGKTWEEIVLVEYIARTTRKAVIRFAAPTKQQAKEIIIPNWQIITEDCPSEFRALDRTQQEGCYIWPTTGSRLYLAGTDDTDQIDRLRGPYAHLIIIDELGFHHCDLQRLVHSVLAPQLATTRGKMIMSTTPPESMEHPCRKFIDVARKNGSLITRTVFDNPMLAKEDVRAICLESNGLSLPEDAERLEKILREEEIGTPSWEREYKCKLVTDETRRVVREFVEKKHTFMPGEMARPSYFTPYTFLDLAFAKDFSAALFGYYDFKAAMLVIEDEWTGKHKVLSELRDALLARELALYPDKRILRFGDGTALGQALLASLTSDWNLEVIPCTMRANKESMINTLRELMGAGRIMISKNCKMLIDELRDGIFKEANDSGSTPDYKRTERLGHLDHLDALVYGVHSVDWNYNPTPQGRLNEYEYFIHANRPRPMSDQQRAVSNILRGAFRGN